MGAGEAVDPGVERPDGILEGGYGLAELPGSQEADQRDDRRQEYEQRHQQADEGEEGCELFHA